LRDGKGSHPSPVALCPRPHWAWKQSLCSREHIFHEEEEVNVTGGLVKLREPEGEFAPVLHAVAEDVVQNLPDGQCASRTVRDHKARGSRKRFFVQGGNVCACSLIFFALKCLEFRNSAGRRDRWRQLACVNVQQERSPAIFNNKHVEERSADASLTI